jgi:hypothetical protein
VLANRGPHFMDAWYVLRAGEYARRAQGISALSFGASWLLNEVVNPDESHAMLCP